MRADRFTFESTALLNIVAHFALLVACNDGMTYKLKITKSFKSDYKKNIAVAELPQIRYTIIDVLSIMDDFSTKIYGGRM